jgi:hypothetical protein
MYGKAKSPAGEEVRGGGERRRQEWLKTGVYVVAGLSIFALGLWRSFEVRDPVVHAGERLPPFELPLETGRRLRVEPGRWTWIFAGSDSILPTVEQAARWSPTSTTSPRVLLLRQNPAPGSKTEAGIDAGLLSALPQEIRARLGVADGGRRILLVDPKLEVIFASRLLRVADVDALYRRYLGLADEIPREVRLTDFKSESGSALAVPAQWFVFHQGCSECSLSQTFEALRERWPQIAESCSPPHPPCSLVVDPRSDIAGIRSLLDQAGISVPVTSVARLDRLFGLEDRWLSEALVVRWNERGRVVDRRTLRSLLERMSKPGEHSVTAVIEGVEVDLPEPILTAGKRVADLSFLRGKGTVGLLDGDEHLLRFLEDGETRRELGGIGVRPGDLFYPEAFDWLPEGGVAVHDAGNGRIELFDRAGRLTREFWPSTRPVGLSVTADGSIFLGEPANGQLVTRYDSRGRRQTSFGALLYASSELERLSTNRVLLARGEDGELWLAFLHHLRVRRYSEEGALLAEIDLGPMLGQRGVGLSAGLPEINIDGVQLPVKIQDISFAGKCCGQTASGSLWLLLGDNTIVELTSGEGIGFLGRLRGGVSWGQIAARTFPRPGLAVAEFRGRRVLEFDLDWLQQRLLGAEKGERR